MWVGVRGSDKKDAAPEETDAGLFMVAGQGLLPLVTFYQSRSSGSRGAKFISSLCIFAAVLQAW